MSFAELIGRLGVALGIGLLVGLQREYAKGQGSDLFAGARTFALIGFGGGLAALASDVLGSALIFAAALLLVGVFIAIGYYAGVQQGEIGQTTEVAALVIFLAGGLAVADHLALAAAIGVATTTLLAVKAQTRQFAANIDREDIYATVKFAILAVLILPLLPTETFGPSPFNATSPFKVGLMVVLISGLSFIGYVLIKIVDARRGVAITGVLGGLVSSTAATMTLSERSKDSEDLARPLALGILLAWSIMFIRIIIEIAAVNPSLLSAAWLPITAGASAGLIGAGFLYFRRDDQSAEIDATGFSNPFRLRTAIQFGLLYGVVLIASKAASEFLGDTGVFVSAVVSGVADVDAITLSMAELSIGEGSIDDSTAATAIALAAATNTLVKGGIVFAIASGRLRRVIVPGLVAAVGLTLAAAAVVRL